MKEFMFRNLRADEIDVRVSEISRSGNGLTLLLYKNARADMGILDETVTPMGWEKSFHEEKGTLFCCVSLWDGKKWVSKEDAGAPSNYESQKGEASDAFKRACTNWGIGRELYTAPRIWIDAGKCSIRQNNNGKRACYDRFSVAKVITEAHRIKAIAIRNDNTGRIVFVWQDTEFANRARPNENPSERERTRPSAQHPEQVQQQQPMVMGGRF